MATMKKRLSIVAVFDILVVVFLVGVLHGIGIGLVIATYGNSSGTSDAKTGYAAAESGYLGWSDNSGKVVWQVENDPSGEFVSLPETIAEQPPLNQIIGGGIIGGGTGTAPIPRAISLTGPQAITLTGPQFIAMPAI